MKKFLDENFLLQSKTAQRLYHEYASRMPIIDYHCHLPVDQIASDHQFENLTQAWLYGDHYKWRAMRAHGIDESFCTGNKTDLEKFKKWAETVPYTLRNPLYHWTHLELQRYFDVFEILNSDSAEKIYETCSSLLRTKDFSTRNLLRKKNVRVVCTTDDPTDDLSYHKKLQAEFEIRILPAFRPDKAMQVENAKVFNEYVGKLEEVADVSIHSFQDFLRALKQRHDFFASMNCSLSDHGLEHMYDEDYTEVELENAFNKIRAGKELNALEVIKLKSGLLYEFAVWDYEKGWVQQFHLGAIRNNNTRKQHQIGADAGCDSIGDFQQAKSLAKFLNRLDKNNQLTKTVLYNLNPRDNELMATMAGNFNEGPTKGKIQYGSAWWFLDQKDGIVKQLNALSSMGLLSNFIGMLTDSRSFLSFPRHEYFRRVLCNLLGNEIEDGELPNDLTWTGKVIQDICYNNAVHYFNWKEKESTQPMNAR